jgi:hypothetical protein
MGKRKSSKKKGNHSGKKPELTNYTGPYEIPKGKGGVTHLVVNKSYGFLDATSVGGILVNSFKSSDVVNCADWTSIQNTWKEFRVLAMELEYVPVNALSSSPISIVLVRDHTNGGTPLTSMAVGLAFDDHMIFSSQKLSVTRFGIKASSTEELQFQTTSGSSTLFSMQSYSTAGSISTNYFFVTQKFVLELRGMK